MYQPSSQHGCDEKMMIGGGIGIERIEGETRKDER
jgi:hypothetical protein